MISHGYCNDSCLNEDDPGTNPLPFNDTNADTKCDLVQFSFDDLDDPINDQNFTKQSANLNGRPFYYSMNQSILWWSNVEESWLYSAYVEETAYFQPMIKIKENLRSLSFSNETKWKNISQEQENGIIKSKCSTFSSQCLARRDGKYRFQFDNTTHLLSSFELTATSPVHFRSNSKEKCTHLVQRTTMNCIGVLQLLMQQCTIKKDIGVIAMNHACLETLLGISSF